MLQQLQTAAIDDAISPAPEDAGAAESAAPPEKEQRAARSWLDSWHAFAAISIGIIPLPIYALLGGLILAFLALEDIPQEISMVAAVMVFFGCTCGEIGKRLPLLRNIGGAVILATFIPSYLVYHGLIPAPLIDGVTSFTKSSKFLYVFIAAIIVGSILGMNRQTLVQGFLKIFIPIGVGSIVAGVMGTLTGVLLGIGLEKTFFFIVVPIMAGGVGEGAIPLSIGYSEILGQDQGGLFAEILPVVMLGSLTAIILAGLLNHLGKARPELTGEGTLTMSGDDGLDKHCNERDRLVFDAQAAAAGGLIAITLYLSGVLFHDLFGLPAPVAMLFLAVLIKLARLVPPKLEDGAYMVYKFFHVGVTYPLLFAIGVSMTPWDKLVYAFNPAYLCTIFVTVTSLIVTGLFIGRKLGMYPIETAIVNACHSGQGGTGDIAILTAANRMVLMPFAQISTRIGGAVTVTLSLIALAWLK